MDLGLSVPRYYHRQSVCHLQAVADVGDLRKLAQNHCPSSSERGGNVRPQARNVHTTARHQANLGGNKRELPGRRKVMNDRSLRAFRAFASFISYLLFFLAVSFIYDGFF